MGRNFPTRDPTEKKVGGSCQVRNPRPKPRKAVISTGRCSRARLGTPTKTQKFNDKDQVSKLYLKECCQRTCILKQFTYVLFTKCVNLNGGKTEREKDIFIHEMLLQCRADASDKSASTISKVKFKLKVQGKEVCVAAFRALMTVSQGKLSKIVQALDEEVSDEEEEEDDIPFDDTRQETKKQRTIEFLTHMKEVYAEPVVGIDNQWQLTQFFDRRGLYDFFLHGVTEYEEGMFLHSNQ